LLENASGQPLEKNGQPVDKADKDCSGCCDDPCCCTCWPSGTPQKSDFPRNGWNYEYDITATALVYDDPNCTNQVASCTFTRRVSAQDDDIGICASWDSVRLSADQRVVCIACNNADGNDIFMLVEKAFLSLTDDGKYIVTFQGTVDNSVSDGQLVSTEKPCGEGITGAYPDTNCREKTAETFAQCDDTTQQNWSFKYVNITVSEVSP